MATQPEARSHSSENVGQAPYPDDDDDLYSLDLTPSPDYNLHESMMETLTKIGEDAEHTFGDFRAARLKRGAERGIYDGIGPRPYADRPIVGPGLTTHNNDRLFFFSGSIFRMSLFEDLYRQLESFAGNWYYATVGELIMDMKVRPVLARRMGPYLVDLASHLHLMALAYKLDDPDGTSPHVSSSLSLGGLPSHMIQPKRPVPKSWHWKRREPVKPQKLRILMPKAPVEGTSLEQSINVLRPIPEELSPVEDEDLMADSGDEDEELEFSDDEEEGEIDEDAEIEDDAEMKEDTEIKDDTEIKEDAEGEADADSDETIRPGFWKRKPVTEGELNHDGTQKKPKRPN